MDPARPGFMLRRGTVLQLDPESYPKHAVLAARLRGKAGRGWEERPAVSHAVVVERVQKPAEPGLLPHQLRAIADIRKNLSTS